MSDLKHEEQLRKVFSNVNDWLKFAEAKNLGLLTLNAALVFGFAKVNSIDSSAIAKSSLYVFTPCAIFSFLIALISLFPIVSKIEKGKYTKSWINKFSQFIDVEEEFENIHYYGYLKNIDEDKFESDFLSKINSNESFTKYEKELATQILYNSRITWLKYQLFKIGAFLFLVGIILFLIVLPIFKLFIMK
jgi:hypothetical protein